MTRGHLNPSLVGASLIATTVLITACGTVETDRAVRRVQGPNGLLTFVSSYKNPDTIEKIIGSNELTPVINDGANIPAKYRPLIDAFGKISMGCTATHIGHGVAITAGHCFEAPEKRINNKPCDNVTIEWGYRKDKAPYMKSKCTMVLAAELNDTRDYAIFKVDNVPPVSIEVDTSERPKFGTALTIFGHPQLRPLEWSQTCTLEKSSNGGWGADEFSHQCDTEPGNSGSTVINDTTLKIIGIHDGGRNPWNYATYIVNTPIKEFIGDLPAPQPQPQPTQPVPQPQPTQPVPAPTATPNPPSGASQNLPSQSFGPFRNNEARTLAEFDAQLGQSISFVLDLNTESDADYVRVIDGSGHVAVLSGQLSRSFTKLRLPVKVSFLSDERIRSKRVSLQKIIAYK